MFAIDLLNEVGRLQEELAPLFSRGPAGPAGIADAPALNVWTTENELRVTAALPGIDPNQVEVSVQGDELTLRGSWPERPLVEGERWIRREHVPFSFVRTLQLPFRAESEKVRAEYVNDVLSLTLPRAESEKPKRIPINAAA